MRTILNHRILLVSLSPFLLVFASSARADIYQWEYIDPADPAQGRQQSSTLAPDGAGVSAMPAANLSGLDLSKAYLSNADFWGTPLCTPGNACQTYPSNLAAT